MSHVRPCRMMNMMIERKTGSTMTTNGREKLMKRGSKKRKRKRGVNQRERKR